MHHCEELARYLFRVNTIVAHDLHKSLLSLFRTKILQVMVTATVSQMQVGTRNNLAYLMYSR